MVHQVRQVDGSLQGTEAGGVRGHVATDAIARQRYSGTARLVLVHGAAQGQACKQCVRFVAGFFDHHTTHWHPLTSTTADRATT